MHNGALNCISRNICYDAVLNLKLGEKDVSIFSPLRFAKVEAGYNSR
jgi:hypothetical protein